MTKGVFRRFPIVEAVPQSLRRPTGKEHKNKKDEKVGTIDDIIIAPDKSVSYAIVGAGGFAGIGKHDVAIPVTQFEQQGGKFILPGATKDKIKQLPEFEYAK